MKEAYFFETIDNGVVRCTLCPHFCVLKNNQTGICRTRKNVDGRLLLLNENQITAIHMDPIEKKPLFHYKPSSLILSVGSFGCNFSCGFCQNHTISLGKSFETIPITPEHLVERACELDMNIGIAYTYNEPTVFYELMRDTAIEVKKRGKDNVLVTNGYINEKPLRELIPYIDAANVDLKAFNQKFYSRVARGDLKDVLRTIQILYSEGVHLEITHLLIQGFNDNIKEFNSMINWIAKLDPKIPLHISRYYPSYKFTTKATDVHLMKHYAEVAKKKLDYVYVGNVAYMDNNTYCPKCNHIVIRRSPYYQLYLVDQCCEKCGAEISVVL